VYIKYGYHARVVASYQQSAKAIPLLATYNE